jgi:hypothetical protein
MHVPIAEGWEKSPIAQFNRSHVAEFPGESIAEVYDSPSLLNQILINMILIIAGYDIPSKDIHISAPPVGYKNPSLHSITIISIDSTRLQKNIESNLFTSREPVQAICHNVKTVLRSYYRAGENFLPEKLTESRIMWYILT